MFPKPTFGSTNATFGSFNAGASTSFGGGGFKTTAPTSAFGAPPAFGATNTQPATGGGLFGSTSTTGGLFGSTTTAAPATGFGANTSGFGFGASTSTGGGGLFSSNTSTGGLFGSQQTNSAFGAKPSGFGFGSTTTAPTTGGGLFGATSNTGGGLFGQQNNTLTGGGLFSNTAGGFGQQPQSGTAHAKYNPVTGTDSVVKSGTSQTINIKHHCITCMKEYENKSLEELRLEDYAAGRKGATGGMFGGFQQTQAGNKPMFGGSTFGQPTTSATSVFGGGGLTTNTGFGQTNTFSFGGTSQAQPTTGGGLFGAPKPAFGAAPTTGTGLFGATTTQPLTFGTSTSTFGFGNTAQNPAGGGLFGAKPTTSAFGATAPSTGFGAFGTAAGGGGLFGAAKPQQTQAPTFGQTAPAFGGMTGGFGANTGTTGGGLFGSAFGKPTTSQPAFGFTNTQTPALGTGLGVGLGGNTFQPKPAATGFGVGLGGGSLFQTQQPTTTFKTGLEGGLGGGMFGGGTNTFNSTLPGTGLGGFNAYGNQLGNNTAGAVGGLNVHEHILAQVAGRPYGDNPLYKNIRPDTTSSAEDALRPTNPAAVKAVLDNSANSAYRVTSPTAPLRVRVTNLPVANPKKSLFDGLEEYDPSLDCKLSLKPSRKRLVLRKFQPRDNHVDNDSRVEEGQNSHSEQAEQDGVQIAQERERDKELSAERINQSLGGRRVEINNSPDAGTTFDKRGNWLSPSKVSWGDSENPISDEPTPRLYPNLDKELPDLGAERRASWLTTKPLRKPLVSNPEAADSSIRDLGMRERPTGKENVEHIISEDECVSPREVTPHPAGVKLTRSGYYTIPSLDDMIGYMRPDGSCVVPHLTIGRRNYGNVYYDCEIDVAGLDLDALVHFLHKEVTVYPDDADRPPLGEGLNRRAIITLDRIWPIDKTEKRPITDPDRLMKMDYEMKLRRACDKHDAKFLEYRPETGSWVFRVEHFSKYDLTDSDEEDVITNEVLKRQLVNQAIQKSAAPQAPKPVAVQSPSVGLGGLGGLGALELHTSTSLNLLSGAGKAFEMDTTEDNADTSSMYHETSRAFGVKSPTSELARLEHRQSHNVQLMKASLYADTEMEDDVSTSTGDQQVPRPTTTRRATSPRSSMLETGLHPAPYEPSTDGGQDVVRDTNLITDEIPMKPLIVKPDTMVLKYHRKVPPFKLTIAGRLEAAHIADMSVCRARHSRVGFGPRAELVYASSYDTINQLPRNADIGELGKYVEGRGAHDWSEPVVARLAIGHTHSADASIAHEALSRHLEALLEFSSPSECSANCCPRYAVRQSPKDQLGLLKRHLREAASTNKNPHAQYGVSSSYCYEVWRLCDALWAADLENDGVPGTDVQSVVDRHRRLLRWMSEVVADVTERELAEPGTAEPEDETDGHSARVWTLLLGGRILEACKVAREQGDLNMAVLLAQAAGDASFRSLIARQLSAWRECGALQLIATHRRAALQLLAGAGAGASCSDLRDLLLDVGWTRALHATARYLCPQVPSLERIITTYESFFVDGKDSERDDGDHEAVDMTVVGEVDTGMQYPLPPYTDQYEVNVYKNGTQRRILDLRYELLRARAFNMRPKLQPAAYTPDPLDYSLCFLVGTWLGYTSGESVCGVAAQLEAAGAWHLAVQALAYHPDDNARGHLIRGVISRHAPARADTPESCSRLQLVRKLGVPAAWLHTAQAHRARYQRLPAVEAEHLVNAGLWNAAHRVLIEELLPEAVLADDLQSISPLLDKLSEAAQRHEVSGWESGGQALYHYIHVCDEIRGAVCSAEGGETRSEVQTRLRALRPRLAAACRALAKLPTTTARSRCARTEMGARLVQVCATEGGAGGVAGGGAQLAALLAALRLPPDCTYQALYKITSELAEQASESCVESVSSSPLSLHQRS